MIFKKKYIFSDITILYRKQNGAYGNFSDYGFTTPNHEIILENHQSDYLLSLCNTTAPKKRCITEITVEEIMKLANLKNGRFLTQLEHKMGEETDYVIVLICAKKILNYRCGECILVENDETQGTYEFFRNDGRNHMVSVLQKTFRGA